MSDAPMLPFTLRVPTDRVRNDDGAMNVGTNYVDVQVICDPEMEPRGEVRQGYDHPVIALREWSEQVFLHELLHVATGHSLPLLTTTHPPHGHDVIARIEVALWETGWRRRLSDVAPAKAEKCPHRVSVGEWCSACDMYDQPATVRAAHEDGALPTAEEPQRFPWDEPTNTTQDIQSTTNQKGTPA